MTACAESEFEMDGLKFGTGRKVTSGESNTEWETPPEFFERLNREFMFGLDACADIDNFKLYPFLDKAKDSLARNWDKEFGCAGGRAVFMNPPYGRGISEWVRKAYEESRKGLTVVGLLPANTDTAWWHDYVMKASEIRFVRGRIKFLINGKPKGSPNFGSAVVVWQPGSVAPVIGTMNANGFRG